MSTRRDSNSLIPPPMFAVSLGIALLFFVGGVAAPLSALVFRSLSHPSGFGAFIAPDVLAVVRFTLVQAGLSTAIAAVAGLALGLWSGARVGAGARRDVAWFALPFSVPTVVAATAWVWWLGRSGPLAALEWSYSLTAVIVAHVFFNVPWVALWVARARGGIRSTQLDAAATLGARWPSRFGAVIWPEIKWPFAAALTQVFGFCVMSFALVLILGGGPPVETLETAIYARLRMGVLDLSGAVACGVWELLLALAPWVIVQMLRSRAETRPDARSVSVLERYRAGHDFRRRASRWPWLGAVFVIPYAVLWIDPEGWSSLAQTGTSAQILTAFWVSAKLAGLAALGSLTVAGAGVVAVVRLGHRNPYWASVLSIALVIPAGLSVLVLGIGFWLGYAEWIDPFDGSLGAMVALQITVFTPIVYRVLWGLASASNRHELEAASTLGAGPFRAFMEVEWPRWRAPVVAAGAMVAAASLGEVAAVSLFYSEHLVPLPMLIARWMGQYRFGEAKLVAGLLLVLSLSVTFAVRERDTSRG